MLELVLTRPRDRRPDRGGQGPVVPGPRRAAHLPRPPGRGRGAARPPAPGHLRRAGRSVHRHLGHDDHGGRRQPISAGRSPRWRPPCSECRSSPAMSSGRRWSGSPIRRLSPLTHCVERISASAAAGRVRGLHRRPAGDLDRGGLRLRARFVQPPARSGAAARRLSPRRRGSSPGRPARNRRRARQRSRTRCRPGHGSSIPRRAARCSRSGCTSSCPRATTST